MGGQHHTRRCPSCALHFPVSSAQQHLGAQCPLCQADTLLLPEWPNHEASGFNDRARGAQVLLVLDNVRSVRNVGSIMRTADGAGCDGLWLGGITPTPQHPQFAKTALGAEHSVPWRHHRDTATLLDDAHRQGYELWCVEGGPRSESVFELRDPPPSKVCLVLGHEVSGVDPRLTQRCTRVIRLPMLGIKGSLNVSVAAGVCLYTLRFGAGAVPV